MSNEPERNRAFGEFMRNSRINAIKSGKITAEPGELDQLEESSAKSTQTENSKDQGSGPQPIGFLFSRDVTAKEAAEAIKEMTDREERGNPGR